MTADTAAPRSRRAVLAALLGAGAASIAGAIVRPERADASGPGAFTSGAAGAAALTADNTAATGSPAEAILASNASGGDNNVIHAKALGTTGFSNAVYGEIASNGGNGVFGYATDTGTGYTGGVSGESDSSGGVGVWGYSGGGATGTMGVTGPDDPGPIAKTGVLGVATQASGQTRGVVGRTLSPGGVGVQGVSGSTGYPTVYGNVGVHGLAAGRGVFGETVANGTGVHGLSPSGLGVRADTTDGTALKATASSDNGIALRAIGRVKFDNAAGIAKVGGVGVSPAGAIAVTPGCTLSATSAIVAMFNSAPPDGTRITLVKIISDTKFVIYFNQKIQFVVQPVKVAWHVFG